MVVTTAVAGGRWCGRKCTACSVLFALWFAAPPASRALQPQRAGFVSPPLVRPGRPLGRRLELPLLPLLPPRPRARAHTGLCATAAGGRGEEGPSLPGELLKHAAADVVAKAAGESQGAVCAQLLEAGQVDEAVKVLVRLCLQGTLGEGETVTLWRRTALQPRAIAEALEEEVLSGDSGHSEVGQAYGLTSAARVLGLVLGHTEEALLLLSGAHQILADSAGRGSGGEVSGDIGPGESWAAAVVAGEGVGARRAGSGDATEKIKSEGAQGIMAVVGVTVAQAAVLMRAGDYKGAYEKQTAAVALLTLLTQASSPALAAPASAAPGNDSEASATSGNASSSEGYEEKLAEQVAVPHASSLCLQVAQTLCESALRNARPRSRERTHARRMTPARTCCVPRSPARTLWRARCGRAMITRAQVQAAMARELGRYDEAELMCRRALLALSLQNSVSEPAAAAKIGQEEWWDSLNVSSPYRSPTRSASHDAAAAEQIRRSTSAASGASWGAREQGEGSGGAGSLAVAAIRSQLGLVYLAQASLDDALLQMRQVLAMNGPRLHYRLLTLCPAAY